MTVIRRRRESKAQCTVLYKLGLLGKKKENLERESREKDE